MEFSQESMFLHADSASLPTVPTGGDAVKNAKLFPAATVTKLLHHRRGERGTRSEERRDALRADASKKKCQRWRSQGVVGVPHPIRRKNEGKNMGRKHLDK